MLPSNATVPNFQASPAAGRASALRCPRPHIGASSDPAQKKSHCLVTAFLLWPCSHRLSQPRSVFPREKSRRRLSRHKPSHKPRQQRVEHGHPRSMRPVTIVLLSGQELSELTNARKGTSSRQKSHLSKNVLPAAGHRRRCGEDAMVVSQRPYRAAEHRVHRAVTVGVVNNKNTGALPEVVVQRRNWAHFRRVHDFAGLFETHPTH